VTVYALDLDWDLVNHLADPDSVEYLRTEYIQPEVIEDPQMRAVFEWQMDHLRQHGVAATASVLEAEFDYINIDQPQTVIADLVQRLRERYGRNEGQEVVRELAKVAVNNPADIGKELISAGRKFALMLTPKGEAYGEDDFKRAMKEYDRLVTIGRGPSLGFDDLDDYFYGQLGLTFLVGAPKSMKSWFTIKAFYENIMMGKRPWLYSLELPAFESDMRLRCMAAKVPYWKFTKRQLTTRDRQDLEEASEILQSWGNYRIEKPPRGERNPQVLVERARDAGADCVFIDQLQYVENYKKRSLGGMNETGEYWEAINEFRDYSDEGPVFIVHQFNRSVMNADKMPEVQQAKGSSGIEECATLALGLWASKEMRKSNVVHVGTLVSRNYEYLTWEAQTNFKNSCHISIVDTVDDDDS
jgi:hypothetical protein